MESKKWKDYGFKEKLEIVATIGSIVGATILIYRFATNKQTPIKF